MRRARNRHRTSNDFSSVISVALWFLAGIPPRYAACVKPYRRKLSRQDAETGSILIEKSRWREFPPPMQEFAVEVSGRRVATRIVAEDCVCVPPPHQHYHLEAGHFRSLLNFTPGAIIEIDRADAGYAVRNG